MDTVKEAYNNKLKNRLFTCLCERENDGSWEACLDAIIIEFMGIPEEERGGHAGGLHAERLRLRRLQRNAVG